MILDPHWIAAHPWTAAALVVIVALAIYLVAPWRR